jgi:hypothetical protein
MKVTCVSTQNVFSEDGYVYQPKPSGITVMLKHTSAINWNKSNLCIAICTIARRMYVNTIQFSSNTDTLACVRACVFHQNSLNYRPSYSTR